MCVCFFFRSMCLKFLLRDDFESLICWLYHWLSYMLDCIHVCVFLISKNWFLKAISTPPQYLAICRASSAFSYRNPDNFSIPGGSIENGSASSIAFRHLVDRLSFCSWFCWVVPRHLLDTSAVDDHFLDSFLDRCLDTSRHLHLSRFTTDPI